MTGYQPMASHLEHGLVTRFLDKLGFQRHHVSTDDRGEIVWLTRTLP